MSGALLLALWIIAFIVLAVILSDLLSSWWKHARDRSYFDRLADHEPEPPPPEDDEGEQWKTVLVGSEPESESARSSRGGGIPWSVAGWPLAALVVALLVFFVVSTLLGGFLLVAAIAAVLAVYIPWLLWQIWWQRRALKFEERMVDAVDLMTAALEAGENTSQALVTAAEGSEGAVRRELREVARRLDLGMEIERALRRLHRRYPVEGVRLFVQSLIAKWHAGGDLAPMLRAVSRILRDRLRVRLRTRSELAGFQYSALLVAFLPYVLIPFFALWIPTWFGSIFAHPAGPPLLLLAVLLQILGLVWLWRMLRTEF